MKLVGERLRQERQKQGLDLKQIASSLCINHRYLVAIEGDDWGNLPGGFFSRSFVRQYATHLGMDPSQFEGALDEILGSEPEVDLSQLAAPKTTINVPPMPAPGQSMFDKQMMLSLAALVGVILGCSGLYAVWQRSQGGTTAADSSPNRAPVQMGANKPQIDANASFSPKPVIPAGVNKPAGSTPAASASQQPPATPSNANNPVQQVTLPVPNGTGAGLQVAASEPTWLEVTMNGKMVFMGVLERGQSRDLQHADAARILVGNAGGVAMRWNGKDIGPIGPKGQVRRVVFTKESYEIQFPGKPASD